MAVLVKTGNGLAFASIKTRNGLAAASMKSWGGLDTTGGGGGGGIALIGHTSGTGTSSDATTGAINTTGADLLVCYIATYGGPLLPTDSKGNTWNALTSYGAGVDCARFYWSKPTSVGAGHTMTEIGTVNYPSIYFAAFSGVHATPFDKESGLWIGGGGTIQPGSTTPAVANSLLVCGTTDAGATRSIDSGFTRLDEQPYFPGAGMGGALAYLVQAGGPSAVNPTWTGAVTAKATSLAVFKPV